MKPHMSKFLDLEDLALIAKAHMLAKAAANLLEKTGSQPGVAAVIETAAMLLNEQFAANATIQQQATIAAMSRRYKWLDREQVRPPDPGYRGRPPRKRGRPRGS